MIFRIFRSVLACGVACVAFQLFFAVMGGSEEFTQQASAALALLIGGACYAD